MPVISVEKNLDQLTITGTRVVHIADRTDDTQDEVRESGTGGR